VVTVRAEQPGDGTFAAAPAVEQSFTVYEVLTISSFSADAAAVKIGAAVTFSVASNFSTAGATFDFGDGSAGSGSSATHVYTSAGSYRVTVTFNDAASGQSATAALTVTVSADAPAETPMVAAVKPVIRFRVQSGVVKLMERASQSDSIAIKGVLHVPAGVTLEGQAVTVNIGGVARTFVLDASGRAASGNAAFQLKVQQRDGVTLSSEAPFSLKLVGGSFAATMKACCPLHTNGLPSEIAITVGFNGQQIRNIQTMEFKGRGAAKTAKLGVEQSDLSR
jgi:PKD repeat protein